MKDQQWQLQGSTGQNSSSNTDFAQDFENQPLIEKSAPTFETTQETQVNLESSVTILTDQQFQARKKEEELAAQIDQRLQFSRKVLGIVAFFFLQLTGLIYMQRYLPALSDQLHSENVCLVTGIVCVVLEVALITIPSLRKVPCLDLVALKIVIEVQTLLCACLIVIYTPDSAQPCILQGLTVMSVVLAQLWVFNFFIPYPYAHLIDWFMFCGCTVIFMLDDMLLSILLTFDIIHKFDDSAYLSLVIGSTSIFVLLDTFVIQEYFHKDYDDYIMGIINMQLDIVRMPFYLTALGYEKCVEAMKRSKESNESAPAA